MIRNFNENYEKLIRGHVLYRRPDLNANSLIFVRSDLLNDINKFLVGFDIIPRGTPVVKSYQTIYAGRAILTNNSNVDQKLKTDSFVHQESFTTTSKVTQGFSLGLSASAKFGFNIKIANVETTISVNTNYNFSSENLSTSTVTKTITIPSQEIIVPANTSLEVVAYFTKGVAEGYVDLRAAFKGMDGFDYNYKNPSGTVSYLGMGCEVANIFLTSKYDGAALGFDKLITSNISGNRLYAKGIGQYSCDAVNQFRISITPISGRTAGSAAETKIIDVEPIIEEN